MRRTASALSLTLALLCFFTLLTSNVQLAKAITIYRDGTVVGTDKIRRDGNVYTLTDNIAESIVIDGSNLKLDGSGFTLDGEISLNGGNITVTNFVINSSGDGISVYGSACTIIRNKITAEYAGIRLFQSSNNVIAENSVDTRVEPGIELTGSFSNVVSGNSIKTRTREGVYLSESASNLFTGNNITSVHLYHSSNNILDGNNVYEGFSVRKGSNFNNITRNRIIDFNNVTPTPLALGNGNIAIESSIGNFVSFNILVNSGGIFLHDSTRNVVRNNSVSRNGVCFDPLGNYPPSRELFMNTIDESNTINGKPIYYLIGKSDLVINASNYPNPGFLILVDCQRIIVHNSLFSTQGVWLAFTTDSTIFNNEITKVFGDGIRLISSSRNNITANNITGNSESGIALSHSTSQNLISMNYLEENSNGVQMVYGASNNTISGNSIAASKNTGVGFIHSSSNTIYHNNFIDNRQQAYDYHYNEPYFTSSSTNFWSNGKEGNYWSNYNGEDIDGNGIGDSPYTLNAENSDPFPLMKPIDISKGGPDFTKPIITILSPANITYSENRIQLAFTVDEAFSQVTYGLDGQTKIPVEGNTTLPELSFGSHNIIVYVTDTAGNVGMSETIFFNILKPFPTVPVIAAASAIIAVAVATGLLVYFKKRKH